MASSSAARTASRRSSGFGPDGCSDGKFGGDDDRLRRRQAWPARSQHRPAAVAPATPSSTTSRMPRPPSRLSGGVLLPGWRLRPSATAGRWLQRPRSARPSYDNELLDAHYITGDGRGNENIGLSAVHHVFHSEHNHTVEQVKIRAIESGDLAFLNEWLLVDLPATRCCPGHDAEAVKTFAATLNWDGERLFQAARFTTEMQYQHLVFEEFARKVQPDVDAFVFNPSVDINPAIFAEFAHVVYRFGHSMLRETVDRSMRTATRLSMDLFDAFLNPLAFGVDDTGNDPRRRRPAPSCAA